MSRHVIGRQCRLLFVTADVTNRHGGPTADNKIANELFSPMRAICFSDLCQTNYLNINWTQFARMVEL